MQPKRATLARTIHCAAKLLQGMTDQPEMRSLIAVIDDCANELLLRTDTAFFTEYERQARELNAMGQALLAQGGMVGIADRSDKPRGEPPDEDLLASTALLNAMASALGRRTDLDTREFFEQLHRWECSLYARRLEAAPNAGVAAIGTELLNRERLLAFFRSRHPDTPDLEITEFRMLPGGFSKITVLCAVTDSVRGAREIILRVEPTVKFMELDGMDLRNEFPVIQLAHRAGIPVAEPLLLVEDTSIIGMRFTINRRAAGHVYGTVKDVNRPLDDGTVQALAELLAQVHNTPFDRNDPLVQGSHLARWIDHPSLRANTLAYVDYWSDQIAINGAEPSPVLTRTIDWLRANAPEEHGQPCLLHGDFGLHNMMIDNGRVTALLDWENSRIGDPAEEVAHLFAALSGKIDQTVFMAHYLASGGRPISAFRLRYFDVLDSTNVALACMATLARLDNFSNPNIFWSTFGLKFLHHYISRLEPAIREAEAARSGA